MAGFSTVTGEESIMFADNVSFDGTSRDGAITTNGELLIGSTIAPNIKVGTLTSPNSTISIGYSSPNITLDLVGGTEAIDSIAVQAGTSPVLPTAAGLVTINGSTVAAGSNPVRTNGTGPNTMSMEVQISQAIASTDATKIGLSNFNSSQFSVDANGFVSVSGTGVGQTITGDTGGALSPTAGNWNILGSSVASGSTPVSTSGLLSTLTVNVQTAQAIASTNANSIGLASFDSSSFDVDANGFVELQSSALGVLSVSGTPDRITSTGGQNPVIDIASNYVGQTSITTLGTVATGTWNGSTISEAYGGTNQTTYATGDILYASSSNTLSKLAAGSDTQVLTLASGVPSWATPTIGTVTSVGVQANDAPGTNPVLPDGGGLITVNGAAVANHSVVLETRSRAANTYNVEIQYAASSAATDATKSGVAHFDSSDFSVDANGFVSVSGTGVGQTITGDTGGALSPTAGNWNILGSHGLNTSGTGSTLTAAINNAITLGDLSAIAAGSNALSATTGDINIAAGNLKLPNTTSDDSGVLKIDGFRFLHRAGHIGNSFCGAQSGNYTLTSINSTGIGYYALNAITIGNYNSCLGSTALQSLKTGSYNSVFGYNTGTAYTTSESSNILINNTGTVGESNVCRIGSGTGTGNQQLQATYISGIDGVNVGSTATVVTEASNRLGTAVLTAGTGIAITPGANTITISNTSGGFPWSDVSGAFSPVAQNGYFVTGTATGTLPASPTQGQTIQFFVDHATEDLTIQASGTQIIRMGNSVSSAGGTAVSNTQGDSVELIYRASNNCWCAVDLVGTWTLA